MNTKNTIMKLAALATWIWAAASLPRAIARGSRCQETDIECRLLESDDELLYQPTSVDETSSLDEQASKRKLAVVGSSGTLNILVLPISWADRPEDRTLPTTEELNELWNGVGVGDNYPSGSIANWTHTNSYGSLTLSATIAPWITSDNTEFYYADGNSGRPVFNDDVNGTNVYTAIEYALGELESIGFDFSPFDQDNDGFLDAVAVLHSGYSAEEAVVDCYGRVPSDRIQSHRASAPTSSTGWSGPDGLRLGSYTIASAYIGVCNAKLARLGIIVHEFIHFFDFPELYDVEQAFEGSSTNVGGVGGFDVMANPAGQGDRLSWPGHLSPWTKYQLRWMSPDEIISDGTYTLRPSELYPDCYVISYPYPTGEYLMLEVRRPLLFDSNLWQPGGLVIYHVDEAAPGPGNQQRGYPGQDGWPGNGLHYTVAVLQQDGEYALERGLDNGGISDFWTEGTTLGPGNGESVASTATYPNTDSYQGGIIKVTGLTISDFSDGPDGSVSFSVKGLPDNIEPSFPTFTPFGSGSTPAPTPSSARKERLGAESKSWYLLALLIIGSTVALFN